MQNITNAANLKLAIQSLKIEQKMSEEQLKAQFRLTYENLKPSNIIRNTIKDITSEPALIENLISTGVGLAGGYLSKKIVVWNSNNIFRKLFGSLIEFGVTKLVAHNPDAIKSVSQYVYNLFSSKKKEPEES